MNTLSVDALHVESGEDVILDVRSPEEYLAAHIPGSVLHPLKELEPRVVRAFVSDKARCVVLRESGTRSVLAAQKRADAGIEGVHPLDSGIDAWICAGKPLRGTGRFTIERQVRIVAGGLVLTGVALSFLHPAWIVLSVFVGFGLVFAGNTNFCGRGLILKKMPWNRPASLMECCTTCTK